MLLTTYHPRTVKEGRWTDPLNKMSPRNTTMINHTLQIISTCMNERQSKGLSHCLTACFHSLRQPPLPPRPHFSSLTLCPPHSYREEVCLKRNNSPHTQKAILTYTLHEVIDFDVFAQSRPTGAVTERYTQSKYVTLGRGMISHQRYGN